MAAGDITRDTGSPGRQGNAWLLTGTIEVDDTYRGFALTDTKSRLISCMVVDEDGAGSQEVDLNVNGAGTATNGSIGVVGNHVTVNTKRFQAMYR